MVLDYLSVVSFLPNSVQTIEMEIWWYIPLRGGFEDKQLVCLRYLPEIISNHYYHHIFLLHIRWEDKKALVL